MTRTEPNLEGTHPGPDRPPLQGKRVAAYVPKLRGQDYFMRLAVKSYVTAELRRLIAPACVVADVGCGEQPFRTEIERLGGRYLGIDVTQNGRGNVDVIAPITRIPLENQCVDLVLCTEVLEHVSDTYGAFRELSRILRPDGHVVLTVPFAYRLHEQPYDFVRLTPHQVTACAEATGLTVDVLQRGGNDLEAVASAIDQMLTDVRFAGSGRFGQAARCLLRLCCNGVAVLGTKLLPNLPRLQYLSTQATLRKPAS
jgi:SAM-dependent methyltransferase